MDDIHLYWLLEIDSYETVADLLTPNEKEHLHMEIEGKRERPAIPLILLSTITMEMEGGKKHLPLHANLKQEVEGMVPGHFRHIEGMGGRRRWWGD